MARSANLRGSEAARSGTQESDGGQASPMKTEIELQRAVLITELECAEATLSLRRLGSSAGCYNILM